MHCVHPSVGSTHFSLLIVSSIWICSFIMHIAVLTFSSDNIPFRREFLGNKYHFSQGWTMRYTYFPTLQGSFYCTIILFCLENGSVSSRKTPVWSTAEPSEHCSESWFKLNVWDQPPVGQSVPSLPSFILVSWHTHLNQVNLEVSRLLLFWSLL